MFLPELLVLPDGGHVSGSFRGVVVRNRTEVSLPYLGMLYEGSDSSSDAWAQ